MLDRPPPPDLVADLVAENFGRRGSELTIGGVPVSALAAAYGTPLYVYDRSLLRQRYRALKAALAGFADVYFSIKANPNPAVAATFVAEGAGLEIASGAEFLLARKAGADPDRIIFAGPGKSDAELHLAITGGVGEIHLESMEEIASVGAICEALQCEQQVSIRINPEAGASGGAMRMGGKPAAFGFDEEQMAEVVAEIVRFPRLKLQGIHLFAGTQVLQADVLLRQWAYGLDLAARLADLIGGPLRSIDLGGGLGIPYQAGNGALDLSSVANGVEALKARVVGDPRLASAHILIEPGRWLTGPAGLYLMAVRAVKHSRGQRFIICDGGMHHHLAASGNLGQVIKLDYPILAATRLDDIASSNTHIVGPLCTPLDTLGRQTAMPFLEKGDLIAVLQSGAYGLSSSPVGFLGHPMPAEVMVENGQHWLVREGGQFHAPLVNLTFT
jgi:diaminopimelate decarboxylase